MHNARRMKKSLLLSLSLLVATTAFGQALDPLRNVSGTTPTVGAAPWVQSPSGGWTFFHGFDAHVTYVSQTGPEDQENEVFSTNWLAAGLHRNIGDNAFLLIRGRVSLEPYTTEDGYPQLFQHVSAENGGPLVDRMRPQELFGEAAVQFGYRPSRSTLLHVYAGLVGQPALGPAPWQLRPSGVDFAEAPFAYDLQESYQTATSVVTGGFNTGRLSIEASAFHDAVSSDDYTELDTGGIDSQSARVTLLPSNNFAIQVSRGELGEGVRERTITSASITYGAPSVAVTALWTRRERDTLIPETTTAYGLELALRGTRNTFMVRAENVDRPAGFPLPSTDPTFEDATHLTAGYIFDFTPGPRYRMGVGVNIDYRTQTHDLEEIYGHKPQGIYAFVRIRTAGL